MNLINTLARHASDPLIALLLALLLAASVATWSSIVVKAIAALRRRADTALAARLERTASAASARAHRDEDRDALAAHALRSAIEAERAGLARGQSMLATVAATAPFVGLLGTVIGIQDALIALGTAEAAASVSLDRVAGPVGEALAMTGLGLAVAIPAALAHNAFARMARTRLAAVEAEARAVRLWLATGVRLGLGDDDGHDAPVTAPSVDAKRPRPVVAVRSA